MNQTDSARPRTPDRLDKVAPVDGTDSGIILKNRRQVFQNTRFAVYADHIAAGALEVRDFLVVAPHCYRADSLTGVVVVPVRGDSIMLLKRHRHAISQHVWELPRGFIDAGEEPVIAAVRELAEETGLDCLPDKLMDLGTFFPDPGILTARVALFAAPECRPGVGRLEDEIGLDDAVWHSHREIRKMLRGGELQEGASCLALYRYFSTLEIGGQV
jgi:8-oxo-dGTP pyrophosphatase MutT (NUDIX family)